MKLTDFEPEQITKRKAEEEKKKAKEEENSKIMDLLGRFSAEMLMERLRDDGGHPTPEWGDAETWRFYYLDECSRRGLRLLEQLGWTTDENSLYVNLHTGSVETLKECALGISHSETIAEEVWSVIEHWEPYDESKPNEYKIKYLKRELEGIYKIKSKPNKNTYDKDQLKKIPEYEKEIQIEMSKTPQPHSHSFLSHQHHEQQPCQTPYSQRDNHHLE